MSVYLSYKKIKREEGKMSASQGKIVRDIGWMCQEPVCHKPVGKIKKFCPWCGTENPHFDEDECEYRLGALRRRKKDCTYGHPTAKESRREFPGQAYCFLCGVFIGTEN